MEDFDNVQGFGNMQEKLDIKILILYILRRLPGAVDAETLGSLALADGTLGYFEYAECLSELLESGHIEKVSGNYLITEKGSQICETVESTLPYTVRSGLKGTLKSLAEKMRRRAMLVADHEVQKDGVLVHLSMSDGVSNVLDMHLLCGSEEQASKMESNFRTKAENYYNQIMEALLE